MWPARTATPPNSAGPGVTGRQQKVVGLLDYFEVDPNNAAFTRTDNLTNPVR
jgi:hypothetical protein